MKAYSMWAFESLGKRVATTAKVGSIPPGRIGVLVSIQSGYRGGKTPGVEHATVAFDANDWSDEENVPLDALRPV